MRYVSLFSGIGGFERAIHKHFPDAKCELFCELDDAVAAVYEQHYPNHRRVKDVKDVKLTRPIDLVVAGFPCQDLSIGNMDREGLNGDRSRLFYEAFRVIQDAKYYILENVASMDDGWREIISARVGSGPIELDAAKCSTQDRKRLFWTNFRVPPIPSEPEVSRFADLLEDNPSRSWDLNVDSMDYMDRRFSRKTNWDRSVHQDTDRAKAHCITAIYGKGIPHNALIDRRFDPPRVRHMTPLECERIMGFPDQWTLLSYKGLVPDAKRFKMIGNSISVPVADHVVGQLPKES